MNRNKRKQLKPGDPVLFVDLLGKPHHALVLQTWTDAAIVSASGVPGISAIFVEPNDDEGYEKHIAARVPHHSIEDGRAGFYWVSDEDDQFHMIAGGHAPGTEFTVVDPPEDPDLAPDLTAAIDASSKASVESSPAVRARAEPNRRPVRSNNNRTRAK